MAPAPDASEDSEQTFESQPGMVFTFANQKVASASGMEKADKPEKPAKAEKKEPAVEIKVGGYAKMDAIATESEHGGATGNREDLMVPGAIETSGRPKSPFTNSPSPSDAARNRSSQRNVSSAPVMRSDRSSGVRAAINM